MSDVVRVKWWVRKGICRTTGYWEYDRAEWEATTPEEREKELEDTLNAEISNHVDAGWHIEEGDDE